MGAGTHRPRPVHGRGLASGIVNTGYQVGSALGLAAMTAIATANGADRLGDLPALTDGFSAAFTGAVLAAATLRTPRPAPGTAVPAERSDDRETTRGH